MPVDSPGQHPQKGNQRLHPQEGSPLTRARGVRVRAEIKGGESRKGKRKTRREGIEEEIKGRKRERSGVCEVRA